jgi:hypothetical protein
VFQCMMLPIGGDQETLTLVDTRFSRLLRPTNGPTPADDAALNILSISTMDASDSEDDDMDDGIYDSDSHYDMDDDDG